MSRRVIEGALSASSSSSSAKLFLSASLSSSGAPPEKTSGLDEEQPGSAKDASAVTAVAARASGYLFMRRDPSGGAAPGLGSDRSARKATSIAGAGRKERLIPTHCGENKNKW